DAMERWTNGVWVATPHMVDWPDREGATSRLSIAFFAVPSQDAVLECFPSCLSGGEKPRYVPFTMHDLIAEKMRAMMQ
ncbi:hypothetical protein HDU96_006742, partial [Phlyctochytrium bullatum]